MKNKIIWIGLGVIGVGTGLYIHKFRYRVGSGNPEVIGFSYGSKSHFINNGQVLMLGSNRVAYQNGRLRVNGKPVNENDTGLLKPFF